MYTKGGIQNEQRTINCMGYKRINVGPKGNGEVVPQGLIRFLF